MKASCWPEWELATVIHKYHKPCAMFCSEAASVFVLSLSWAVARHNSASVGAQLHTSSTSTFSMGLTVTWHLWGGEKMKPHSSDLSQGTCFLASAEPLGALWTDRSGTERSPPPCRSVPGQDSSGAAQQAFRREGLPSSTCSHPPLSLHRPLVHPPYRLLGTGFLKPPPQSKLFHLTCLAIKSKKNPNPGE